MKSLSKLRNKVVDYYKNIIDQLDIDIETLISSGTLSQTEISALNQKRQTILTKIKQIENSNLKNLTNNVNEDEEILNSIIFKDGFVFCLNDKYIFWYRYLKQRIRSILRLKLINKETYFSDNGCESLQDFLDESLLFQLCSDTHKDLIDISDARDTVSELVIKSDKFRKFDSIELKNYVTNLNLNCNQLKLFGTAIDSLKKNFFTNLDFLVRLEITNHWFSDIDSDTFNGLGNLETLILTNNKIDRIKKGFLNGLKSLRYLEIENFGKLMTTGTSFPTSIENDYFNQLQSLNTLYLRKNGTIKDIHDMAFSVLKDLTVLHLDYNNIPIIKEKTFKGLVSLKELVLSYNKITTIERDAFNDLTNLEILLLDHNKIEMVDKETFYGLEKLTVLNLEENPIYFVHKESFEYLKECKIKYLIELNNCNQS